jgi:hypothetical protein
MIWRLQLWRLLGALAVLAVLSLAPQAASAHAGHSHAYAAPAEAQQVVPVVQDAAARDEQQAEQQTERKAGSQELTEAEPATPAADHGCGERGCCSSCSCTGCHSLVILPVPAPSPPKLSSIVRLDDPPADVGEGGTKLRRPPKSFV